MCVCDVIFIPGSHGLPFVKELLASKCGTPLAISGSGTASPSSEYIGEEATDDAGREDVQVGWSLQTWLHNGS